MTCPACRESGSIGPRPRWFEARGLYPGSDRPVYRCINCGVGIVVRRSVLPGAARAELIDPDEWGRMEYQWGRDNPLPLTDVAPLSAADLASHLRAAGLDSEELAHLIAEAAEITHEQARDVLARHDRAEAT